MWIHGFASGAQIFRCTGETLNCIVEGEFAPSDGIIFHDCYVYYPATGGILGSAPQPGEPTGIPGGVGPWECLPP